MKAAPVAVFMVWLETLLSVVIISAISLVGLLALPSQLLRRHGVMFGLIALAAGTLIGDAFFHLIPESVELWDGEFPLALGGLIVLGFLVFYALESGLRIGHAHAESGHEAHEAHEAARSPTQLHGMAATTRNPPAAKPAEQGLRPFGILNLAGDAVHNFLDGIVIAAAFVVGTEAGIATAVAVAIHEIPQEFGDFGVLIRAGFRPLKAILFNLMSAVFGIVGAVLFLLLSFETEAIEKFAIPIVAGGFLYIAAADLIPELHHHARPAYVPLVVGLLLVGLSIMVGLTFLEPDAGAHP